MVTCNVQKEGKKKKKTYFGSTAIIIIVKKINKVKICSFKYLNENSEGTFKLPKTTSF